MCDNCKDEKEFECEQCGNIIWEGERFFCEKCFDHENSYYEADQLKGWMRNFLEAFKRDELPSYYIDAALEAIEGEDYSSNPVGTYSPFRMDYK